MASACAELPGRTTLGPPPACRRRKRRSGKTLSCRSVAAFAAGLQRRSPRWTPNPLLTERKAPVDLLGATREQAARHSSDRIFDDLQEPMRSLRPLHPHWATKCRGAASARNMGAAPPQRAVLQQFERSAFWPIRCGALAGSYPFRDVGRPMRQTAIDRKMAMSAKPRRCLIAVSRRRADRDDRKRRSGAESGRFRLKPAWADSLVTHASGPSC